MEDKDSEFRQIYEEYDPKIVGYLPRLVGQSDVGDVAKEVFVKVYEALDGFRGESKLPTWTYRIATAEDLVEDIERTLTT